MRNKNGFVLAETLIVVILLTITLMSLYTAFSSIIIKTRARNNNDTIDTIYKTSFVKDLLDSNYIYSYTDTDYSDSLTYYAMKNSKICVPYNYSGNRISFNNDGTTLIVCDFNKYYSGLVSHDSDPLYDVALSYSIDKIYLINFGLLSSNESYNVLDASTIDYAMGKSKKLEGDYLVVKYKKKYVYPNDYQHIGYNFEPEYDMYHSSVQLNSINREVSSTPIYLYENITNNSEKMETQALADGAEYKLSSKNTFKNHPGQVIVGWTNSKDFVNLETFNACYANKAHYESQSILCGKIGEVIKVKSSNRYLYAVWCGDKTLEGAMKCQAEGNASTTDGLFKEEDPIYGDVNYVYRGDGGDNFVKLGNYCYTLVSNFGYHDSIKLMFYGTYNTVKNMCDVKTNFNPDNTYYFNGYNYSVFAHSWMYANDYEIPTFSNLEETASRLEVLEVLSQGVKNKTSSAPCPYNDFCYFGDTVTYNDGQYTISNSDGSEVQKYNFASYEASGYADLKSDKFINKYVCLGGQTTTCSEVYFYKGITSTSQYNGYYSYSTKYYKFMNGKDNSNYQDAKLFMSKNASYNDGKYVLDSSNENSITITLREFNDRYSNDTIKDKLLIYKYMCSDLKEHTDGSPYQCNSAYLLVSASGYGSYASLNDGRLTWTDLYNYAVGYNATDRTKSNYLKTYIDSFYTNNLKTYEDKGIIDINATFCNNLEETDSPDIGNNRKNNTYGYSSYFDTNTYYNSLSGMYKHCDTRGTFLYSKGKEYGGNGVLNNPVGLLTYEEISYVAKSSTELPKYSTNYLVDTAGAYHTMSPAYIYTAASTSSSAYAGLKTHGYYISTTGKLNNKVAGNSYGSSLRAKPVIAIYRNTLLTKGSGSNNNPFIVD